MVRRGAGASVDPIGSLQDVVGSTFTTVQASRISERKEIVKLHKHMLACAAVQVEVEGGKTRLSGEKAFSDAIKGALTHVLPFKRGTAPADRVIQFIANFIKYANEQARKDQQEDNDDEDSTASRLTTTLLKFVLKGFPAKDKNVRFRCAQMVALMISQLGELDTDVFELLQQSLLDRINDKEAYIRVQAVIALAKLQGSEELDEDDADSPGMVLLDVMACDPAADVRRAVILQLAITRQTLPHIIRRVRDVDPQNRRSVYFALQTFGLPLVALTTEQRHEIVRSGLKDREDQVRKFACSLVSGWLDQVDGDLVRLLGYLDVQKEPSIAQDAIFALFEIRPQLASSLDYSETAQGSNEFWSSLTPEAAFLVRVYASWCKDKDGEDAGLPVVTALTFRVEAVFKKLQTEEASAAFVLEQLLGLALLVDYGDENGRRKMFALVRNMFSHDQFPIKLIPVCLDLLLKLSSGEREFTQIVVEVIQGIRADAMDGTQGDKGAESDDEDADDLIAEALTTPVRKAANLPTDGGNLDLEQKGLHLRSLAITRALIERILGSLQDNAELIGLVHELIVPSVRSQDPDIKIEGMACLALCCLLDRQMAIDTFMFFLMPTMTPKDVDSKQLKQLYQTIYDIVLLYSTDLFTDMDKVTTEKFVAWMAMTVQSDDDEAQTAGAIGVAKLMLSGMITDTKVLHELVVQYFAPETSSSQQLRQCLTYFFPVFCYSSPANQLILASVAVDALAVCMEMHNQLDNDETMVAPAQIAQQLIDWTDPQKTVRRDDIKPDETVHLELCQTILERAYEVEAKDERKVLISMLGKLHLPDSLDSMRVRRVLSQIAKLQEDQPLADAASRNALIKFQKALQKRFGDQLEALDDEDLQLVQAMQEDADRMEERLKDATQARLERAELNDLHSPKGKGKKTPAKRRKAPATTGRKRQRSTSVLRERTPDEDAETSEEESIMDIDARGGSVEPTATSRRSRRTPKPSESAQRAAAQRQVSQQIDEIIGEEDEEGLDDEGEGDTTVRMNAVDEEEDSDDDLAL